MIGILHYRTHSATGIEIVYRIRIIEISKTFLSTYSAFSVSAEQKVTLSQKVILDLHTSIYLESHLETRHIARLKTGLFLLEYGVICKAFTQEIAGRNNTCF